MFLSVAPLSGAKYYHVNELVVAYRAGLSVTVVGPSSLAGSIIDCADRRALCEQGYTRIEFRLGAETREMAL